MEIERTKFIDRNFRVFKSKYVLKFGPSHLIPTATISEGVNGERILSDVFSPEREKWQI
jgi:hypothetical protein